MGSLVGHVAPGLVFVLYGLWWTIAVLRLYHQSLKEGGSCIQNSATYKCFSCKNRKLSSLEVEGIIKVFYCSIHMSLELIQTFPKDLHHSIVNFHHSLILFFFVLSGIMDLLVHYKFALPTKMKLNYITLAIAMSIQGFLFSFHNQDCPMLEVISHRLLIITSFCLVIIILLDMKYDRSLLTGLGKSFFMMLLGTWMSTVGFLLYPPGLYIDRKHEIMPKEWDDPDRIMMTPILFGIEFIIVFISMIIISVLVSYCNRNPQDTDQTHYTELNVTLLGENKNGHAVVEVYHDKDIENK